MDLGPTLLIIFIVTWVIRQSAHAETFWKIQNW